MEEHWTTASNIFMKNVEHRQKVARCCLDEVAALHLRVYSNSNNVCISPS